MTLWMVSQLFGFATDNKTQADSTQPTTATSLLPPGLSSNGRASSATNDALLKLSTGGGETTADAQVAASLSPGGGLASGLLSANQAIAVINDANSMMSQQLSDALYGAGLTDATLANTKVTFADIMANDQHEVAGLSQLANDPTLSDAARQSYSASSKQIAALASSEQAAYDNHTLVFEKASEVNGLDYQRGTLNVTATDGNPNLPPQGSTGVSSSYNTSFLLNNPDGKTHSIMNLNGVDLYLTW